MVLLLVLVLMLGSSTAYAEAGELSSQHLYNIVLEYHSANTFEYVCSLGGIIC